MKEKLSFRCPFERELTCPTPVPLHREDLAVATEVAQPSQPRWHVCSTCMFTGQMERFYILLAVGNEWIKGSESGSLDDIQDEHHNFFDLKLNTLSSIIAFRSRWGTDVHNLDCIPYYTLLCGKITHLLFAIAIWVISNYMNYFLYHAYKWNKYKYAFLTTTGRQ